MYHTSLLFLLLTTCAISAVQGAFVVKSLFQGVQSCSSSGFLSSIQVLPLGKCIDLGADSYAKVVLYSNTVVTYECTDPLCEQCTTTDQGGDTVNSCHSVDDENGKFLGMEIVQISTSFPTQYGGHTIVKYGQSNCAGDWAEVLIDVAGANNTCGITDGMCRNGESSMSFYCTVPSFLTAPYKFDLEGKYIFEKYYSSSSCSGTPGKGAILAPGACQTYLHSTSRYFEIVSGGQIIEYTCLSGNCTSNCKVDTVYSVDQCTAEANIFDGTQYKTISVVKGFPKTFVEHMELTVQYDGIQEDCSGQPTVVKYETLEEHCYTGCLPVLFEGSFCGGKLFLDDLVGIKHKKDAAEISVVVIGVVVGVILVIIAAGVIGFILYRQNKNRRAAHHFHQSGPLTSPLLNGEDDVY